MALLNGIRILSVEQYGAGPFGTQFLAALGAEVIKVEQPEEGGDVSRQVGPHFHPGLPQTASSLFFQSLNAGKKSLTLSLRSAEGRALFHRLCRGAHAVASNLRGDVPARLGLTYAQLREVNPAIVCAHLTGYGREGERAAWPGYDYLMQAEAGYFALTGEPDSPPARMGLSVIDYMTGVVMSLGLVSGVLDAQRTGQGCDVDVSLMDVALSNLNYVGLWQLNAGAETTRQPRSAHPSLTPCQLYTTRDGWIFLMCNKEKFWLALCERIGQPALALDPRFASYPARLRHRDELTVVLDAALRERTTAEWMAAFGGQVPAAPVRSVAEALEHADPQALAELSVPGAEPLRLLRSPLRDSKPGQAVAAAPALGEHTAELLAEIGIDAPTLAALRARGVV
jgi:crotonobetainyl-CoA:carnitine CoA-transferase CaiB-like acyl-CoA transferase